MSLSRRQWIYIFFGLLLLLVAYNFSRVTQQQAVVLSLPDGERIFLEIADSPEERMIGLFFLESLSADQGMIFVFEEGEPLQVWTRHYSFPVDLVWLDAAFQVVTLEERVAPCPKDPCPLYTPSTGGARYALQLSAGQVKSRGLSVGDQLTLYWLSG